MLGGEVSCVVIKHSLRSRWSQKVGNRERLNVCKSGKVHIANLYFMVEEAIDLAFLDYLLCAVPHNRYTLPCSSSWDLLSRVADSHDLLHHIVGCGATFFFTWNILEVHPPKGQLFQGNGQLNDGWVRGNLLVALKPARVVESWNFLQITVLLESLSELPQFSDKTSFSFMLTKKLLQPQVDCLQTKVEYRRKF